MRVISRPADRFERALGGERISDEQIAALVATSQHLVAVGAGARGPAPDPDFVATLRERLMTEAATLPTPSPSAARTAAARRAAARRAAARSGPAVVVVGRGLPRALAGAAASALLVGSIVGVVSRGSVPGDSLYPVKGWLDSVAVRLADSDLERGTTHLSQAQEHISDARDLASRPDPDQGDIDVALVAAIDSVRAGQRDLDAAWTKTGNRQALLVMRDFTARALPQVDALRTGVPVALRPRVAELEALLRDTEQSTTRRLGACGSACAGIDGASAPGAIPGSLPGAVTTSAPSVSPTSAASRGSSGSASGSTSGGVAVPGTPVLGGGSTPAPGISVGGGGATIGGPRVGATVNTTGATVNAPTVSASVPIVSSTVVLPLPSVSIGTTGVTATVSNQTVGPITLPGATIKLP